MSLASRAFEQPRGLPGRFGATLMAWMGRPMREWALELLEPEPGHHVLEIGPAHGALIEQMTAAVPDLKVTAVEPSPDMIAMASRRNRALVEEGRLEFHEARISAIPCADASFDRVVTTHTVYFWPDLQQDLAEVVRVMRPGGRLVIGFKATRDDSGEWCVAVNGGTSTPSTLTISALRDRCASAGLGQLKARLRHLPARGPLGRRQTFGSVVGERV